MSEKHCKVIVPFNFTHKADVDGIGCALLSNLVFDGTAINKGEVFLAPPMIIPLPSDSRSMEPIIEKITNTDIVDLVELSLIMADEVNSEWLFSVKPSHEDLEFLIIITDIFIPDNLLNMFINKLKSLYGDNISIDIWKFDHHKSNPSFNLPKYEFDKDNHYLPNMVDICTNYMNHDSLFHALGVHFNNHNDVIGCVDYQSELLDVFGFNAKCKAERSATFIYFKFLFDFGLFNGVRYSRLHNIVKTVYHISNYDTFEFDKLNNDIPVPDNHADALTVLWKSYKGNFFKFLNDLETAVCTDSCSREYPLLPDFGSSIIETLTALYSLRNAELKNIEKHFKILKYERIKNAFNLSYDGLSDDSNVAVIFKDVDDVSFIGNSLLKKYSSIKMVILVFIGSRTVSFRSNNHDENAPDVGIIAKNDLGGGGHKYASGAIVDQDKVMNLLTLFWNTENTDVSNIN